jgi:hypothetical protein
MLRILTWLCGLIVLTGLAGCQVQEVVVKDSFEGLRVLADDPGQDRSRDRRGEPQRPRGQWAIQVARFSGDNARDQALAMMAEIRRQHQLYDLHLHREPEHSSVMRGAFDDPHSAYAQRMLEQTRALRMGSRTFADAEMVPMGGGPATNPLDLRRYSGTDMLTLQVAAFDEAGGRNFREAAELYAQQLRRQGEEAYFYHGAYLSMVTIGLFTNDDFTERGQYGPRIRRLQDRHPHNLVNGMTLIERVGDQRREQPSFIVRIM